MRGKLSEKRLRKGRVTVEKEARPKARPRPRARPRTRRVTS